VARRVMAPEAVRRSDNGEMDVNLLVVADCPNDAPATALLRRLLDEVGAAATSIRRTVVTSPQQAADLGFAGSPTFLINGVDPFAGTDRNTGLPAAGCIPLPAVGPASLNRPTCVQRSPPCSPDPCLDPERK